MRYLNDPRILVIDSIITQWMEDLAIMQPPAPFTFTTTYLQNNDNGKSFKKCGIESVLTEHNKIDKTAINRLGEISLAIVEFKRIDDVVLANLSIGLVNVDYKPFLPESIIPTEYRHPFASSQWMGPLKLFLNFVTDCVNGDIVVPE